MLLEESSAMTVKEKAVPAGTDAAAETARCVAGPADAMEAGSAAAHSIISVAIAARATLRRNAVINSAALPLPERPNHRMLAPLFSLIVAVNVQLTAQAAFGTNHEPKSKKTNKNFELRPRFHFEPQFGITKCPFPTLSTYKFPAVPVLHNYGALVCE